VNKMKYCYGVVEDRADPLKIGRVRVRVRGYHTEDKTKIATPDLPWSHVLMPVTSGALGFASNHALTEGTEVFGMFRDGDMQDFVVMGIQQGITQDGFKEGIDDKLLQRRVDFGFNDPRREKVSDYDNTTDGINPPQSSARGNTIAASLEESPHLPKFLFITGDWGHLAYEKEEFKDSEKLKTNSDGSIKSYYPLDIPQAQNINASDVNRFSATDSFTDSKDFGKNYRGAPLYRDFSNERHPGLDVFFEASGEGTTSNSKEYGVEPGIFSIANPQYPYNHATYTESGHLFELDDTRKFERVSLQHRAGTYFEWQPNGDAHNRVVGNNYTLVFGDDFVNIQGTCKVHIAGDADIAVDGRTAVESFGNMTVRAQKNLTIDGSKDINIKAKNFIKLTAKKIIENG
tara:strand:- start:739 stop:1944 length:1206 start_codon:yes stop_codon:yes gene_type:complete